MMHFFAPLPSEFQATTQFAAGAFGTNLGVKKLEDPLSAVRTSLICAPNQLLDLKDLNTGCGNRCVTSSEGQ